MKTTLILLLAALSLPLNAARELTAVWEKHPEKVTTIILADGVEVARKTSSPDDQGTETSVPIVLKDGVVTVVAVAENAIGERSEPSIPFVVPPAPQTPKGFKIVINATITVTPTP